jgi:hypothetical protein
MQLKKKFSEEQLRWEVFWVHPATSMAWPVNDQNEPLDPETGKVLEYEVSPDHKQGQVKPAANGEAPEYVAIGLRILLGGERLKIENEAYQKNEMNITGRGGDASVRMQMDMEIWLLGRLNATIVSWYGITNEKDNISKPSKEDIALLPAWIQDRLRDVIVDMNEVSTDEQGE